MYFIHFPLPGQGLAGKVNQKTHKEIVKKPCDMNESITQTQYRLSLTTCPIKQMVERYITFSLGERVRARKKFTPKRTKTL